ncbi:MAG: acyl-CoA desaturase [Planctomycetota bacterium]|nr:acyl-CoA desaturase [Planctomycetota bacterium]
MSSAKVESGRGIGLAVRRWFDSWAGIDDPREATGPTVKRVDWPRILPFALLHVACLAVIWVGWSPVAVGVAIALYFVRMFAITAFYHRYFSHRTFRTSRAMQFLFAALGNSSVQRGPLWWAAHHREHHQNSDTEDDPHSPTRHGLFWSHIGWVTAKGNFLTRRERVRDLLRFPELCFLDRFDVLVPILMFGALYGFGAFLAAFWPELGTTGSQMLVWGVISTVVLFHATFTINSLAHVWGTRSYETRDTSRNNALLALITLGEGWHNNHHHYQGSVRQGFVWWELDISYLVLRTMEKLGLVWQLNPVPQAVLDRRGQDKRG